MIRHRTRLGLAALATIAATLGPASLAQAKQKCSPQHSQTLASDSYARVYGKNGNAYVCVKGSGKTTKLQAPCPPATNSRLVASGWAGGRVLPRIPTISTWSRIPS